MFAGKARILDWMGALQVGCGLARKLWNRLEREAREKHSSLLGPFVSYGETN